MIFVAHTMTNLLASICWNSEVGIDWRQLHFSPFPP